jgi:proteasome lid subunit RPN8/RPN11
MTQDTYRGIYDHSCSDVSHEVGGMLIGRVMQTSSGKTYIMIEAQLPAHHVEHSSVHLTFTSDTLTELLARRDDEYPDRQVIGWYHTHPGLSVFMSSHDVWLHKNFFPEPWHVALVVDPIAENAGFFHYANGPHRYLHPQAYVGFYELCGENPRIVTWENLSLSDASEIGFNESGV